MSLNIDNSKLPQHIAIIMDGNGRWAKKRNLPRTLGHRAGVEALRTAVETCAELHISFLTVYAFSTENWSRPQEEINGIMKLLSFYIKNELRNLCDNNVRLMTIGDLTKLPIPIVEELKKAKDITSSNKGLTLTLALNYGSRNDICQALRKMVQDYGEQEFKVEDIDETFLRNYLSTSFLPDPDFIIRPSGELRLSNFLLWEAAYSELWFSDVCWPDFKKDNLLEALHAYGHRDRRFGTVR